METLSYCQLMQRCGELEAQLADVVAENAALKDYAVHHLCAVVHWNSWADAEDKIQPMPETPATGTFLAEVRAQGMEMAACALDDVNQFNYANMLDDLVQKLRQEASQ